MTAFTRTIGAALLATVALSGCGEVRKAIGYDKNPPDEFAVVSRAPLAMPPDYMLRPPEPGAPRPQEGTTRDQARGVLFGGRSAMPSLPPSASPAQSVLLAKAGADKVESGIREVVDRETSALAKADRSLTDRIVFWREPEPYGTMVDPAKEAQRLRENQSLGKSLTEGEVPVIKRRKKGLLEGVF